LKHSILLAAGLLRCNYVLATEEKITVYGHKTGLIGDAISASSGILVVRARF
jgi:hypothetical protein